MRLSPLQRAVALIQSGRTAEAEAIYRRMLAAGGESEEVLCNLAVLCGMDQRWPEVIQLCRRLLARNGAHVEAHNNLGAALWRTGQLDGAIDAFRRALQLQPEALDACTNLAQVLEEKGLLAEAQACFHRALELQPAHQDSRRRLAVCVRAQGRPQEAIHHLQQALERDPEDAAAHGELAITLYELGDLEGAIAAYRQLLHRRPEDAPFHNNLGIALVEQGSIRDACRHFARAIELRPDHPEYRYSLGMACLYLPEAYGQGWRLYEARSRRRQDPILPIVCPRGQAWDGRPLPRGTALLVVSEQGYGDTLQFMRYVPHLRQHHGLQVSLCAPVKLHRLIRAAGIDPRPLAPEEVAALEPGPWISLMSLPGRLGVRPDRVLCSDPYIAVPPPLIESWRAVLGPEGRPLIALHWQGDPDHENTVSRGRSFPLEALAPLAACGDVRFVSLQKGPGSEQLPPCSFRDRFVGAQERISATWDFLETAAILANCDLVISSDSALVHLAAALGRPTWLLLKQVPEWRWGLEGERSFWYPSLRLFRQRRRGDWAELMGRVAAALRQHLAEGSAPPAPTILAPLSLGDLIDRITILEIKASRLRGQALRHVSRELKALQDTLAGLPLAVDPALIQGLGEVNAALWQIEDAIRAHERQGQFGESFIHLARSVYRQNDRRAEIKRQINLAHGSALVEEKLYESY